MVRAGLHAAAGIECAFDGQAMPGELALVDLQQPGVIVAPLGVERTGEGDGLGCDIKQMRATAWPIDADSERVPARALMDGDSRKPLGELAARRCGAARWIGGECQDDGERQDALAARVQL